MILDSSKYVCLSEIFHKFHVQMHHNQCRIIKLRYVNPIPIKEYAIIDRGKVGCFEIELAPR